MARIAALSGGESLDHAVTTCDSSGLAETLACVSSCVSAEESPLENWRREGDSNPRYGFWPYTGLANQRLQPLGHLSVFDSEAGLRRALKQFLSAAQTISCLRFIRLRKKLLFHYASARSSNNLSFQNAGVD
jgi:hypothetical protein